MKKVMVDEIQEFTMKLIEELNLKERLHAEENNTYIFQVNANLTLQYVSLNPGLHLVSSLESLPKENRETFLMSLMRINLFGRSTAGGVIGYDEEKGRLTFMNTFPYKLNFQDFKEILEDFINYTELFKIELLKYKQGKKSLLTL